MKNLLKNKRVMLLADQALVSGSQLLLMLLAAKVLGSEKFGEFAYLWLWLLLGQLVIQSTIMATLNVVSQQKLGDHYLYIGVISVAFAVTICSLLAVVSFMEIGQFGEIDNANIQSFIFFLFTHIIFWYLRRTRIIEKQFMLVVFSDAWVFGGRVLFLVCPAFDGGLSGLFFSYALLNVAIVIVFSRYICFDFKYESFLFSLNKFYKISIWSFPASLVEWINSNFLSLVVAETHGLDAVGTIRLAQTFIGVSNVLLQYFDNIIPISAARGYVNEGRLWLYEYIRTSINKVAVSVFLSGLLGAAAAYFLIPILYGGNYADSVYICFLYVIVHLIVGVKFVYDLGLKTIEKTSSIFWSNIYGLLFTITIGIFLIFSYGVYGVVLSMIASQCISLIKQRLYFANEIKNVR